MAHVIKTTQKIRAPKSKKFKALAKEKRIGAYKNLLKSLNKKAKKPL